MPNSLQVLANRANFHKYTGPVTDEREKAVSQNAVKHGLLSEALIHIGQANDYPMTIAQSVQTINYQQQDRFADTIIQHFRGRENKRNSI
jgi:hypothetical protein